MTLHRVPAALLADLDDDQRQVVTAPRGPVRVIAGAGSGKTRVLTRRIAHLVGTEQIRPEEVLALSFTVRAASELRERLTALDTFTGQSWRLDTVRTSTFHAAALRQLQYFWPHSTDTKKSSTRRWKLIDRKAPFLARAAQEAGLRVEEVDLKEVQGEIEWAKASLLGPEEYALTNRSLRRSGGKNSHSESRRAVGVQALADVYHHYEEMKKNGAEQLLDFDDVLVAVLGIIRSSPESAHQVHSVLRCFFVDECQDVTPLQHELLLAWLGHRDTFTAVGDPNQTIYSFAGANPRFFHEFEQKYPHAVSFRLDRNYRSTPQVTRVANKVLLSQARLEGQLPKGPEPTFTEYQDEKQEAHAIAHSIAQLLSEGHSESEIAVLCRTHTYGADCERSLRERGIATGDGGITVSTIHGAKGLEWEAVFLVGIIEGVMPMSWAVSAGPEAIAEERRLLYVGITRARTGLSISWCRSRGGRSVQPSQFLGRLTARETRS